MALDVISNFFTIFLREAPYLVLYFPTIPTFLVLLAILLGINNNKQLISAFNLSS